MNIPSVNYYFTRFSIKMVNTLLSKKNSMTESGMNKASLIKIYF